MHPLWDTFVAIRSANPGNDFVLGGVTRSEAGVYLARWCLTSQTASGPFEFNFTDSGLTKVVYDRVEIAPGYLHEFQVVTLSTQPSANLTAWEIQSKSAIIGWFDAWVGVRRLGPIGMLAEEILAAIRVV